MKKQLLILLAACIAATPAWSTIRQTAGQGKTYTFASLAQNEQSGVKLTGNNTYSMTDTLVIAAKDTLKVDDGATIKMGDAAYIEIDGHIDLNPENITTFTRDGEAAQPVGLSIVSEATTTPLRSIVFEYGGLRYFAPDTLVVEGCEFRYHNGKNKAWSALNIVGNAALRMVDCIFERNYGPAVSAAANFHNPTYIEGCTFRYNSLENQNRPQLNLTAADTTILINNTIIGDTTLNMVGGLGIANWTSLEGTYFRFEGNIVRDNRYGITTMGMFDKAIIKNNQFYGNNHSASTQGDGEAISLYDPYNGTNAYIEGNHIEGSNNGIAVTGCKSVNAGHVTVPVTDPEYNPGRNVFVNNGYGGKLYDFYNYTKIDSYAQGNTWNVATQDSASIEQVVVHNVDDASLGHVYFMPAGDATGITAVTAAQPAQQAIADPYVYSLDGRRLGLAEAYRRGLMQLPQGIYIVGGRKVLVK